MTTTISAHQGQLREQLEQRWPLWPLHVVLAVLFLGPVISPLFRATGLPFVSDAGLLARNLLASYVCPTPAYSYLLVDLPMAVCARCWGATIGLLIGRMAFTTKPSGAPIVFSLPVVAAMERLPWVARLAICALPFLLWPLEIIGTAQGWWGLPLWVLLVNGAQAGCAAGIFFSSLWPGLRARMMPVDSN